jgi:hypothetical protein
LFVEEGGVEVLFDSMRGLELAAIAALLRRQPKFASTAERIKSLTLHVFTASIAILYSIKANRPSRLSKLRNHGFPNKQQLHALYSKVRETLQAKFEACSTIRE